MVHEENNNKKRLYTPNSLDVDCRAQEWGCGSIALCCQGVGEFNVILIPIGILDEFRVLSMHFINDKVGELHTEKAACWVEKREKSYHTERFLSIRALTSKSSSSSPNGFTRTSATCIMNTQPITQDFINL
jgi:hypothetical protein